MKQKENLRGCMVVVWTLITVVFLWRRVSTAEVTSGAVTLAVSALVNLCLDVIVFKLHLAFTTSLESPRDMNF